MTKEIEEKIRKHLYVDRQLENVPFELYEEYITEIRKEVGKSPTAFTPAEVKEYRKRYIYLDKACEILNKRNMDVLGV